MDIALLLVYSAPLALAALGELIGQRSGVINIGLEGMMLTGAFIGVLVERATGSPGVGFVAAALVGIVLGLFSGWFTVKLAADQVVVGTAVNFFALGLTGLWYRLAFGSSGKLLNTVALPRWLGIDPVVWLLFLLVPLVAFLVYRTNWGLALRAAGGYPVAAEAAGFSVERLRLEALAMGGLLAGLAGAYLSLGVANSFVEGMTAGRGFLAIALVTFGRWRPALVGLAALLIGYCQSLKFALQESALPYLPLTLIFGFIGIAILVFVVRRKAAPAALLFAAASFASAVAIYGHHAPIGIPSQLWLALPYVVALVVLVVLGKGTVVPGALGIAYKRER